MALDSTEALFPSPGGPGRPAHWQPERESESQGPRAVGQGLRDYGDVICIMIAFENFQEMPPSGLSLTRAFKLSVRVRLSRHGHPSVHHDTSSTEPT
jgi:hypothetical protein